MKEILLDEEKRELLDDTLRFTKNAEEAYRWIKHEFPEHRPSFKKFVSVYRKGMSADDFEKAMYPD